jgi:hypothetical protein
MAWVNVEVLLEQQGDAGGARHAYQSAIDSGHLQAAPLAKHALARLDRDDQPD